MLEIKNVSKTYNSPAGYLPVLKGITFTVEKGEFVSIIGPSGCGKTTLFNVVSGLERPETGEVFLDHKNITGEKGHVSYMLQKDLLLPWRSVLDNCILGLELQKIPRRKAYKKAADLLDEFNLSEFA